MNCVSDEGDEEGEVLYTITSEVNYTNARSNRYLSSV